ncbi:fimbrial protein [Serratia marcescens]|uniref:fimbrial protein n=1 Tax=Serratia marcescens TaxID=615 RepID=UPI000F7EF04D|nr:fimbrial protein [Serratia marcescens]RTG02239.1 fimbrial protein [Serratia marcescens]RTG54489.1 fimbrial protein [Serratia marcescens]RTG66030.1 fimbrial protein [Serratia marcescens]
MRRPIFLLTAPLWCGQSLADVPITIKGTILEPVCTVTGEDDGSTVDISFGEVNLEDVGSSTAEQPINLKVSCDNPAPSGKTLKMYVHPTSNGSVGPNVLGTSLSNLGIALAAGTDGSAPLNLDTWIPVVGIDTDVDEPVGQVILKARLVTPSASSLQAGTFTAAANLVMSYQ